MQCTCHIGAWENCPVCAEEIATKKGISPQELEARRIFREEMGQSLDEA